MAIARGYVRVSTDEQAIHGSSIEAQKKVLEAYAIVKGYTEFKIYTDEGFSGKNLRRPAVQQLLEEIREGGINELVVWRLDRLSRSLRDVLCTVEDILTPNDTTLVSVTESIDTSTQSGRLMLNVLASFAQSEREAGAERVKMTLNSLAQQCRHLGGPVLLGYKVVDGFYQLDERTAPIVRKCFEMYLCNMGYAEILRYLDSEGIRSPQGNHLTKTSLNFMFSNEKYAGIYTHNRRAPADKQGRRGKMKPVSEVLRIPGGMPAIITMDMWEQVQAKRAAHQERTTCRNGPRSVALLNGLCKCAVCGSVLHVNYGGKDKSTGAVQRYYQCPNGCVKPARKEEIEHAVFEILREMVLSASVYRQACNVCNDLIADAAPDKKPAITAAQNDLADISRRIASITQFIARTGSEAPVTLADEIRHLEIERARVQRQIDTLARPTPVYDPDAMLRHFNAAVRAEKLPAAEAKLVLQAVIRGVLVSDDDYTLIPTGLNSVEMRRVELLSEGSFAGLSPSACCGLDFPRSSAHSRAQEVGSFINTKALQSLFVFVPRVNDVRDRARGQPGLASRH